MSENITAEDLELIETEQKILVEVLAALKKEQESQFSDVGVNRDAFLQLLKDSGRSSETDLPALLQDLQIKRSLENRARPTPLPSAELPYFARLVLKEENRTRTLLLGYSTFLSNHCDYPIVDWRNAPAAKIFYQHKYGDDFEQELPERIAEGVVSARNILTISHSKLIQIQSHDRILLLKADGTWIRRKPGGQRFSGGEQKAIRGISSGFGIGESGGKSAEVSALLDENQFDLLNEAADKPLLILGGAGSGKTTVALHRLASLAFKNPQKFNERSMAVIVPDEGLARLSRNLLKVIGMRKVLVSTFDEWVHKQGRRVIKGLPARLCNDTPARVISFKRHPAMMKAVGAYLQVVAEEMIKRTQKAFPLATTSINLEIPEFTHHRPLLPWMESYRDKIRAEIIRSGRGSEKGLKDFFRQERKKIFDVSHDRSVLFSDHILLQEGAEEFADISSGMIESMVHHTREQLSRSSQDRYSDVDGERKIGVDGQDITKEEDSVVGTVDVEDYPILFELLRRKVGKIETPDGTLHQYAHMVLDEAQDLAPIELGILGMALSEPRSVSIAGDSAQQTDVTTSFESWEHVLSMLGIEGVKSTHLTTNYRSPAPVSHFAHKVLGPDAGPAPKSTKDGAPVLRADYHSYAEAIIVMHDILVGLIDAEPHASIAVIARDEQGAKLIYQDLARIPEARLVEAGRFSFSPGIDVTHVADIKGLEFDYVVIPDANSHVYQTDAKSRRTLHVGCTRAVHQLLVVSSNNPSPLLPAIDTDEEVEI